MGMFSHNGVELEIDLMDAKDMELFEKANGILIERAHKASEDKDLKAYEVMKMQCELVDEFFDSIFGEGTSKKLFDESKNVKAHMEAFKKMMDLSEEARKEAEDIVRGFTTPKNRAQRRAVLKKQ